MAQLTLSDLVTYVQDFIPDKPQAKVGRAANLVLQKIARYVGQYERTTFSTKAITTAYTVAATAGSASVTFSGSALSASDPARIIQIDGVSEWYSLVRVNDTTGTLSSVFTGTTGAALSCKIAYPVVTLPSTVLQIDRIWREGFDPLKFAADEHRKEVLNRLYPSLPTFYCPYSPDSSATPNDSLRIQMLAPPDRAYTFELSYRKRPTLFTVSDGTTTANIPESLNEALLAGTLWYCWDQEDKQDRSSYWRGEYQSALREALGEMSSVASTQAEELDDPSGTYLTENRPIG